MTINGDKGNDFHRLCDHMGPTLTLMKTSQNFIFGSFTPLDWDKTSSFKFDNSNQTFIFSLNLLKKYDMINDKGQAIKCTNGGPIFGNFDFGVYEDMKKGKIYANSASNFLYENNLELINEKGKNNDFVTKECEVYKVIYN